MISSSLSRRKLLQNQPARVAIPVLLALALTSLSWPAGAATTIEAETNRPGGDYDSIDLSHSEPNACRTACENDVRCKAYTYVRPGVQGRLAQCYLKSTVPDPVHDSCCVSGVKSSGSPRTTIPAPAPAATPVSEAGVAENCPASICSNTVATLSEWDERSNSCRKTAVYPCFPFACDSDETGFCGGSCTTDAQCATGAVCNTHTGTCAPSGSICVDSFSLVESDGNQIDCSPYRCDAGTCRDSCDADIDCSGSFRCVQGQCTK